MQTRRVDIERIGRNTLILTGLFAVGSGLLLGSAAAWSTVAGGALATGNLHLIRATVSRLIARTHRAAQGVGLVVLKLVLMVALVAGAFSRLPLEPAPFAAGVSMLLVAILLDACVLGTPLSES
jgi:hypothetical protein